MKRRFAATEIAPWRLNLWILAIVFLVEFGLMLILPWLPLGSSPDWLVGLLDAGILTLVLVPLLAWLIVRPLQHLARIRADLLGQFLAVQEEERGRIARDLHDEIGQGFSTVLLGLKSIDPTAEPVVVQSRLDSLARLLTTTLDEVRRLARGLRPAVLDHLGLIRTIEQATEELRASTGADIRLNLMGIDPERRFPQAIETAVYRVFQEGLTNAFRHARASQIEVRMRADASALWLEIADNGRGVSNAAPGDYAGLGVLGMSERAALLHGTVRVEATKDRGTRVELWVPLPREL